MDPKMKLPESSMLLRLPLEIRRKIYKSSILNSRNPSAETIYLTRLPDDWKDPPSPLLLVNGQVHDEVTEMLEIYPTTLRVTHQGAHFDGLAETCFIADRRSRVYSEMAHLQIDIWPPHPDRPIDMLDILKHLRTLRTKLRAVPPLKQVSFVFRDNEMATWTLGGKSINLLNPPSIFFGGTGQDDVTVIMDLFTRVSAAKARFHMPHGLTPGETTEDVRHFLSATDAMMMGRLPIDEDRYNEEDEEQAEYQEGADSDCEWILGHQGAEIARDKLEAMTGWRRLTWFEWGDFIKIWSPKFELLYDERFKKEYEWRKHYVDDDIDSDYYRSFG